MFFLNSLKNSEYFDSDIDPNGKGFPYKWTFILILKFKKQN